MPHSPDLIDSILKEAGFFDDMKSKLTGFFQSREKKRAVSRVGAHFDAKDKDWDRVVSNSSRKSFVKELAGDARADDKLKMHVDSMNRLKTGKVLSTVSGTEGSRTARRDGSQSYKIVKLRGSNRLGCTCRDWRFKKSVAAQGEQADCKHIREFKQMNKTAGNTFSDNGQTYDVEKLWQIDRPGKVVDHESLLKGTGRTWGDRPNRYGWRDVLADPDKYPEEMARIENADLSYPILVRDRDDVVIDGIHRLLKARKTGQPATGVRVTPEDMQSALSKMAAHPTYAAQLSSLSRPEQKRLLSEEARKAKKYGRRDFWKDPRYRAAVSLKFPKLFPSKRSWRELTDRDFDKIVRHYRKCRTDRDRYMALRTELGALGLPKDVWRQKVRAVVGTLPVEQMQKEAGHVEDRIAERAPGSTYEVAKIEAQIPSMKLRKGQTYHVPLKRGKGYAVIGDIGPKHVVKTVLGPNMRPPGHRAKVAMADVSSKSMQEGDVVVMTMGPKTYIGKADSSLAQRAKERIFRKTSPAMQGGYTHSGIYVGKSQIVEARGDGVRKRSLRSALKNIDGAVVVRPKADKKTREGAAEFAKSRVGAAYESEAFLTRQGVSLLAPKKMEKLLKRKSDIESTKKFTCGNLVSAAYVSQGFTPRKDKGEWSLTVPADFLNADKADRIKAMGSYADAKAKVGRLAGQKLARAPRDYKQEYAQYHGKPEQVGNRSLRNQARRKMGLKKGDPREVDHKTPVSKGGGNGSANLRVVSRRANRTKFTDKK